MPPTTKSELTVISAFTTRLALRPDGERVCVVLAREFYDRCDALWPHSTEGVTPQWIAGHVFEILAVCERLYGEATCLPLAHEFFSRMAWLPELLKASISRRCSTHEPALCQSDSPRGPAWAQ